MLPPKGALKMGQALVLAFERYMKMAIYGTAILSFKQQFKFGFTQRSENLGKAYCKPFLTSAG